MVRLRRPNGSQCVGRADTPRAMKRPLFAYVLACGVACGGGAPRPRVPEPRTSVASIPPPHFDGLGPHTRSARPRRRRRSGTSIRASRSCRRSITTKQSAPSRMPRSSILRAQWRTGAWPWRMARTSTTPRSTLLTRRRRGPLSSVRGPRRATERRSSETSSKRSHTLSLFASSRPPLNAAAHHDAWHAPKEGRNRRAMRRTSGYAGRAPRK